MIITIVIEQSELFSVFRVTNASQEVKRDETIFPLSHSGLENDLQGFPPLGQSESLLPSF